MAYIHRDHSNDRGEGPSHHIHLRHDPPTVIRQDFGDIYDRGDREPRRSAETIYRIEDGPEHIEMPLPSRPSPRVIYAEPDIRARPARTHSFDHHRPAPEMYFPGRSRSRVHKSRSRVFVDNINMHRYGARVETSESLFNESIQTYYQTGEGVGAVEALLPEDSDDEGPRRLSSLPILSGNCPHGSRRKRRLRVATKPSPEGVPEQCECGKEKKPKVIK